MVRHQRLLLEAREILLTHLQRRPGEGIEARDHFKTRTKRTTARKLLQMTLKCNLKNQMIQAWLLNPLDNLQILRYVNFMLRLFY